MLLSCKHGLYTFFSVIKQLQWPSNTALLHAMSFFQYMQLYQLVGDGSRGFLPSPLACKFSQQIVSVPIRYLYFIAFIVVCYRIAGKFGGELNLVVCRPNAKLKSAKYFSTCIYVCRYRTIPPNLNPQNIVWGKTTKFNDCQYFRLYGIKNC